MALRDREQALDVRRQECAQRDLERQAARFETGPSGLEEALVQRGDDVLHAVHGDHEGQVVPRRAVGDHLDPDAELCEDFEDDGGHVRSVEQRSPPATLMRDMSRWTVTSANFDSSATTGSSFAAGSVVMASDTSLVAIMSM